MTGAATTGESKSAGSGFTERAAGQFDRHEHEQINYWKPNTVGDLPFNFWD